MKTRSSFSLPGLVVWLGVAGLALSAPADPDVDRFTDEDRSWWAIQPVTDPVPPEAGAGWAKNGIDRFVARKLAEAGLEPAPEATPAEFLRRICFDLHGLPPAPEMAERFLAAAQSDYDAAVEALVEELLGDRRYGERWAQHWLDVVRYAESDGYRADFFRPGAWRYRDYVIDSFAGDKPYDRFVREQLAGDELHADDPMAVIGTAFLRHGIYEYNQRNARMHWELIVNEMTNVTGEVFLGLGIGCAQCHDHKFDPILQKDYYALQAFLATTYWPRDRPFATPAERAGHEEKERIWNEKTAAIRSEMDGLLERARSGKRAASVAQFPEDIQSMMAKPAAERTPYEAQMAELVERQVDYSLERLDPEKTLKGKPEQWARYQELDRELKRWDHLRPEPLPLAFLATDISAEPAKTWLVSRRGREEVAPGFLTLLGEEAPPIQPREQTTGRRAALAEWIARADNPLSTRVVVNRIWQGHFGTGIVSTPNDFGNLGDGPSHPELLDWLTRRFLEGGWRFHPLHRLILTSATYRQTARREPGAAESRLDPGNRLWWRFQPRRLAAEEVRDAMLAASGELKERDGGPSVPGTQPYRSIYVKKLRNTPDPVLNGFDAPQGFDSAPSRLQTTTPTQSLLLVNGEWPVARAAAFAQRLWKERSGIEPGLVERAYRLAYGRPPSPRETEDALAFLRESPGAGSPAEETPPPKFAGETGLRPADRVFPALPGLGLGKDSLWLQPGSPFEKLRLDGVTLEEDAFTIEAVVVLDNLHRDASVNTLLSRWDGNSERAGWTLGVTSEKSKYDPRNFIVQLVGENGAGNTEYAVVASNLRVPLGRPVYLAASISAEAGTEENGGGLVRFYLKDLGDPGAPLETAVVPHPIAGHVQTKGMPLFLSGRESSGGHLWDGQVARLVVSRGSLRPGQLLLHGTEPAPARLLDARFDGVAGEEPLPGARWVRAAPAGKGVARDPRLTALTDFCHALLSSNEFLYLH